jgi:hypothetical protein
MIGDRIGGSLHIRELVGLRPRWAVYRSGARVSGVYRDLDEAARMLARLKSGEGESRRNCLRCRQSFESSGPGNRLCPCCQNIGLPDQMAR